MTIRDATSAAASLLEQLNHGSPTVVEPIAGGRNNRTYRVAGTDGQWLLKQYYRDSHGSRDRCASEWAWTNFCWQRGVEWAPQPLAWDVAQHCALFEFIVGRRLLREEVCEAHVEQAAAFVTDVNRHRGIAAATALPPAADACFSWVEHVAGVDRRVQRLRNALVQDALDAELQRWLDSILVPFWQAIARQLRAAIPVAEFSRPLPMTSRCLSPSDFGFHNALLTPTGRLRFVDFEYAGWDDPAKLICDFYWQQELQAPRETQSRLIAALAENSSANELEERVERLFPVHGIKWCCLLLNEFLAEDRQRREFAGTEPVTQERRAEQLALAQRLLLDVQHVSR